MTESDYLIGLEDDYADLQARALERRVIVQPDTANDTEWPASLAIPIIEAVAACMQISARSHEDLKPYETAGGMLT